MVSHQFYAFKKSQGLNQMTLHIIHQNKKTHKNLCIAYLHSDLCATQMTIKCYVKVLGNMLGNTDCIGLGHPYNLINYNITHNGSFLVLKVQGL